MNKRKVQNIYILIIIMLFTQIVIPAAAEGSSEKGGISWESESVQLNEGESFETALDFIHPNCQRIQVKIPKGLSILLQQMKEDKRNQQISFYWDYSSSTLTIYPLKKDGKEEKALGKVFIAFKISKASSYSLTAEAEIENTIYESSTLLINAKKQKEEMVSEKEQADLKISEEKKLTPLKQKMKRDSILKAFSTQSEDEGTVVSSWSEFIEALDDPTVHVISLSQSISKGFGFSLGIYRRDITINGNGHTIDFGTLSSLTLGQVSHATFTMKNVKVKKTGSIPILNSTYSSSAGWKAVFQNVESVDGSTSGLANLPQGTIQFDGGQNTYNIRTNIAFISKHFIIKNGAILNAHGSNELYYTDIENSTVQISEGSQVSFYSENDVAMQMNAKTDFNVTGQHTLLKVEGNSNRTGDEGALITLVGDGAEMNITDHAEINVHSKRTSAVLMNSSGGILNVSGNSKLNLRSDSNANSLGATLRFRLSGNMTFKITDNSEMNINKTGGDAPAVRMYGDHNKFFVRSGGKVSIKNTGNGSPANGGSDAANQGILFTAGNDAVFDLQDEGSIMNIQADNGPALDMDEYRGSIEAGKGTTFIAEGRTRGINNGIFNAGRATVSVDQPKFYDFRNNRSGGGSIFQLNSSSSFTSTKSDLAVWQKGSNLDEDPSRYWSNFDYQLGGSNFSTIVTTNIPNEFNTTFGSYGVSGATLYSRMSGNNARAVIDELRVPTDADHSIYGHVTVPIGDTDGRDAWKNEAYVKVEVTKSDGTKYQLIGKTYGSENRMSVYGDAQRAGLFKIELPDQQLLNAGDEVEVISAWRGKEDPSSPQARLSKSGDLKVSKTTVVDVTPPNPAVITNATSITNATKQISGTNGEPGAAVTVKVNGSSITGRTKVNDQGEWQFYLPAYLQKNDVVQVFLTDEAGQAANIKNPPSTNSNKGNTNPVEDLDYHDTTFKKAVSFQVKDVLPDENTVTKSVSVNNENQVTRIGSILTYTLSVKNNKSAAVKTEWGKVILDDVLNKGLDFIPSSIQINGEPIGSSQFSYDEGTKKLQVQLGNLSSQEEINVVFKAKVNENALEQTIKNKASATGEIPQEAEFKPGQIDPKNELKTLTFESNEVENPGGEILGILDFVSAPKKLSFGEQLKISPKNERYPLVHQVDDLIVQDTRKVKAEWQLSARMVKKLQSSNGDTLPNALIYRQAGQDQVLGASDIIIYRHKSVDHNLVNISSEWAGVKEGLLLDIKAGEARSTNYSAIIKWTLQDVPGNG
ncbi:Ig-like domain-containing protein [Bacillus altitudinis]|uniref:pectate lyase-like adhesive domain-containing protein n=1 Tax=Bacillus pumilus TaxID=1408 RepID=UPI0025A2CEBD|nr:pectate lyase-like adhesive domain-containing protein [Bacillus pumilus]MDM5319188.1 Ig-like domain-containing protein [Bacillus pumilus]MDR4994170.1 Ig-like domain-containing protein [Bacillus altitudinis]